MGIKLASTESKKYFFVVCKKLNHNLEAAKDHAKKAYKLEHFDDISQEQLSHLIDLLAVQAITRKINIDAEHKHHLVCECGLTLEGKWETVQ